MARIRPLFLVILCLVAAGWAFLLVGKHHDAVRNMLEPGGLCGQDGGCSQVLASRFSEIRLAADKPGIPVSLPAVPLYLALGVLAGLTAFGKADRARTSALGVLGGLGGLVFGLYLLWAMLTQIGEVCPYCLIMDGLNLAVLGAALWLHPDGPLAGLTSLPRAVPGLLRAPGTWAVVGSVLIATPVLAPLTRPSEDAPVASSPTPAPTSPATPSTAPGPATAPTPAAGGLPPGTRRLVLPAERATLPTAGVPVKGSANAKVRITLFEDFQCPFCKKLDGNVELLQEEMGDKVSVAFMHFPMHQKCNDTGLKKNLHAFACGAAAAAVCAEEQGEFWPMHDLMFRNNQDLKPKDLLGYGQQIGLDVGALSTCMQAPQTLAKIKADAAAGAASGVKGTPALFINGRLLVGAQPVSVLRAAVQAELDGKNERVIMDVPDQDEITGPPSTGPTTVAVNGPRGPFRIDAFEASIQGGKAQSTAGAEVARGVTWFEADAACRAANKRLCTEDEWLAACIGAVPADKDGDGIASNDPQGGTQHVYGDLFQEAFCAVSRKKDDARPLITGIHPRCATPTGIHDMEGLTKEWVGLTADRAGLKGGSYYSGDSARCGYYKDGESPSTKDTSIGFRCCEGAEPAGVAEARARAPGGKVGDTILDWSATRIDGGSMGTKDLKGKPFVMTFWASWCGPCKKELPALAALYEQYKAQGLVVVGMNTDEKVEAAKAYLAASPLPFPVVLDGAKAIMSKFDTRGVPTTFWVTRDGRIRQRTVGFDEEQGTRDFQRYATELLAN
jgi:protein-disulfide isomerase/peroxiredoxin/uncharacterized membrane protein